MQAEFRFLETGHTLTAGVIGERLASDPGAYVADFGALARIEFEIRR